MNPFDHNPGRIPDQNDLIAYHLHELSPRQERALRRILQTNTALAFESVAIAETLNAFPKDESSLPLDAVTLERHWLALRPSLAIHFPQPSAPRRLFRRWALPALAASALAATALFLTLHHPQQTHPTTIATTQAPMSTVALAPPPASSSAPISPDTSLATSTPRPWTINRASNSSSALTTSIRATSTRPTPSDTHVAEASASIVPSTTTASPSPSIASTSATTPTPAATIPPPISTARHTPPTPRHPHPIDASLAMLGDFTVNQTSAGTNSILGAGSNTQIVTTAVGALASVHQQFSPWVGYRVTTTYSRPTFNYAFVASKAPNFGTGGNINSRIYEISGTYVVQGPHRRRISTTAEAGASLLAFLPQPNQPYSYSLRPAATAGLAAEYALTKRFSLRAEYRAQLYKAPDFHNTNPYISVTTNTTFTGNPILGFSYRLGSNGNN